MMYGASRIASRGSFFVASLVALFLISFSLPLFFTFKLRGPFIRSDSPSADADFLFPSYTPIHAAGQRIETPHSLGLDPAPGKDFIVSGWFKLTRFLQVKEKILLLGKSDEETARHAGYIVGLSRDADTVRPIVYWSDSHKGKWYSFADISITAQSWFMLALSFQEDKFLGMHIAVVNPEGVTEVKLLGGYEVEDGVIPSSQGAFTLGALGDSKFKGRIGPIGVFSRAGIGDDLKGILKSLARSPEEVPAIFSAEDVVLWAPRGLQDESEAKRSLQLLSSPRKR